MLKELDDFYLNREEPNKSCLLALKAIILAYNPNFQIAWKYRLPCFMYQNKIFCYLWVDRKTKFPYIAIGNGVKLDHPELIKGNRTFVKLLMVDPNKDIPLETIHTIFELAMDLYD